MIEFDIFDFEFGVEVVLFLRDTCDMLVVGTRGTVVVAQATIFLSVKKYYKIYSNEIRIIKDSNNREDGNCTIQKSPQESNYRILICVTTNRTTLAM